MKRCDSCGSYLDSAARCLPAPTARPLHIGFVLCVLSMVADHCLSGESSLIQVDYRRLISRSDLVYESPAFASVEGIPIGNGRMGTTVWTTPSSIKFQINRVDVFASDKHHAGHQWGSTDYCRSCAWLEIDLGGEPLARGGPFHQRLSLYNAETTLKGDGVRVRCFVSAVTDVLVVEVDDQRDKPQDILVTTSMWRDPVVTTRLDLFQGQEVETGTHTVRYSFSNRNDTILLVQEFDEVRKFRSEKYYCASVVASRVVGRPVTVAPSGERARTITIPAKKGRTTLLVSSTATFSREADVSAVATKQLEDATVQSYDTLRDAHTAWWHSYWNRTFVHLTSVDGLADFFARLRTLHMYYMASSSRGDFPPNTSGLLFQTRGDVPHMGAQFWVWQSEMICFPCYAADVMETVEPFFRMYVSHLPACREAARQRWGVEAGAFYPETTAFDGPVVLLDEEAAVFQDVFLGRKSAQELKVQQRAHFNYDSHLFLSLRPKRPDEIKERADRRPFAPIAHCASSGSEVAVAAWWRYRYTGNREWLANNAYPLLRDTVEFYRHMVKLGDDGRYHIHRTNAHEQFYPVDDSVVDLGAIRGTAPLAIRAAEILDVDADLRLKWKELMDRLAPYPMGSDPRSKAIPHGVLADDTWSAGFIGKDAIRGANLAEDIWLYPVYPFEAWTLETRDPLLDRAVQLAVDLAPTHRKIMQGGYHLSTWLLTPTAAVRAGRGEQVPNILAAYCSALGPFLTNGLSLFEAGVQSMGVEHSGKFSTVIQEGLLQSVSPRPGEPEIISIGPAWPEAWEATFRLLARGGFYVTSAVRDGEVEFVEIESRWGEPCRLRNPWGKPCLVTSASSTSRRVEGEILRFNTAGDERYLILPEGRAKPAARHIAPAPATGPVSYAYKLPSGVTVGQTLGRPKDLKSRRLQQREDRKASYEYGKWW